MTRQADGCDQGNKESRRYPAMDDSLPTYFATDSGDGMQAMAHVPGTGGYLLLTYFSRRICGTGNPAAFSASKQASTMSGLPHR